ncbi:tetratricopeptide repeat protein [Roseibium sp. M-1]
MANINALLDAATKHIENGAVEDAEVLCRQALSRAPRSTRALKTHGMCQIATGDLEAAIRSFEFVLQMNPDDATACYNLALAQNAQGNADLAQLNFERALSLDPQNPIFHEAMAGVHALKGEIETAMRYLLMALELRPDDPGILANLGTVLVQVGAYFDARTHFERVLELQPENGVVALQLSQILHGLGDHAGGLALSETQYLKRPRDPVFLAAFAHSLALTGELDRAADLIDTALKIAPEAANALEEYALISAYRGQPDQGIARIAGLLKQHRDNPHLCLLMATALSKAGKHAESVTLAQPALQDPTATANALTLIRQGLFHQGRFEEARALAADATFGGAGLKAADAEDPDKVIIPLETKPLEAILFARFLARAAETGETNTVEAPADKTLYAPEPLIPLLQRMPLGRRIETLTGKDLFKVADGDGACFIASYAARPEITAYRPEEFRPYLASDPRADDFWRGSLAPFKGPRAGIMWSKYRPEPLLQDVREGLKTWPGTLLSLVWDDQRSELEGQKGIIDAGAHLKSLDMLVDLVGKLDLVVGPDGLVTHIAGAMGIPAIALVTPEKQWYWYHENGRSHWYPSVHVLERAWEEAEEDFRRRIAEKVAELAEAAGREGNIQ